MQEGLKGLYQGVTPNVWGAGSSWGLYFLLYVSYKPGALCLYHNISLKFVPSNLAIMCHIFHAFFPFSYNAIKGYTKEGRQTELSATEHLVSAAQAG